MQNQVRVSVSSSSQGGRAAILSFFENRPVLSAVILFVAFVVLSTLFGLAAQALLPQYQPEFIALLGMSALVAAGLSALGWWKAAGFNFPAEWRVSRLMVIPFFIVLGLPFLIGIKTGDVGTFVYLAVAYALTGFMEEGLMRGIVLRVLKPTGTTRSVVISSLLFGLMHIGNLLYRNPAIVFAQMLGAFVHGIGLSAIRLRTNTIWFSVVLHALHDLALKYTNFPAIPLDVVQVTLLMFYGIYLLRGYKEEASQ
ncbi:lysostaphin resistance A-like protein [Roseiflexus castenholzii]|uniref:CPBP family intramembrane glutamic endopeptidase n=1 Tax=Roseiflexus castenholzii TaxID=120962 RepID=UPI003C7DC4D1